MKNIENCAAELACEYVNGIKLSGSEKFIEKTKRALALMPTEYLDFAVEHLGEIYETEQSGNMVNIFRRKLCAVHKCHGRAVFFL